MKAVLNFSVVWGVTPSSLVNKINVSENYYVSVLRVEETHFYAKDGGSTSFRKFVQTIGSVREQCWQESPHEPQIKRQWTLTFYSSQEFDFWARIWRLLFLKTVASLLLLARLTYKIWICNEKCVRQMWGVSASRKETFPTPSLNMMS